MAFSHGQRILRLRQIFGHLKSKGGIQRLGGLRQTIRSLQALRYRSGSGLSVGKVQKIQGKVSHILVDEPKSGSTLYIPKSQYSREFVKTKIFAKKKEYKRVRRLRPS